MPARTCGMTDVHRLQAEVLVALTIEPAAPARARAAGGHGP